ncbi:MAG: substrate-binding domain-containing protein [Verrucomicrobiota bacterium]
MAVNLTQTKHFKLSQTLGEAIRFMSPGELLPTVEQLKKKYKVSQTTVTQAMERLRAQGVVERPFGRRRLAVSRFGAHPLFRVMLIRPLWSSPDYDTITNVIYSLGQDLHVGFNLYIYHNIDDLNCEAALRNSDAALIIGDRLMSREQINAFNRLRKPVVFLRDKPDAVKAHSVSINDLLVGQMATKHLLDLGHRRIVAMSSEPPNPSNSLRLEGWASALRRAGIRRHDDLIADCSVRHGMDAIAGSYERFSAWLDTRPAPFTALFCLTWTGALAALRALRERKIAVPSKVSIITYDSESSISQFMNPPLTTLSIDVRQYANDALRLVQRALNDSTLREPQKLLLKPNLIVRESTRANDG